MPPRKPLSTKGLSNRSRVHVDDLVGHVTEHDDGWVTLTLPTIATEDQLIQFGTDRFYSRRQNELLHPARETLQVLDELKLNIGSEAFEAQ